MSPLSRVFFLFLALITLRAVADGPPSAVEAEQLYQAGHFEEAAKIYQGMLDITPDSAPIQYNLGNCMLRQGKIGEATLAYRRAQWLDPSDADIEANLRFVQDRAHVIAAPPPSFARRLLHSISPGVWISACIIAWWGGLSGLAIARWRKRRLSPAWIVLPATVLFFGLFAIILHLSPGGSNEAVTLQPSIARFSPIESAEPHFQLSPGAVVRMENRQGVSGWMQIRSEDKTGWVPSDHMARVYTQGNAH